MDYLPHACYAATCVAHEFTMFTLPEKSAVRETNNNDDTTDDAHDDDSDDVENQDFIR